MAIKMRHRQYRSKFDRRYVGGADDGGPPPENPLWARLLKVVLVVVIVGAFLLSWYLFSR
jgi:hypothetical protein